MNGSALRDYPRDWLRPDVIAGLTAAAVVVPKALAYATIAGLPVQVGLYTAFVPMVIYALLGTSRPLSVSTTTTIAILTASALGLAAPGGAPAELAVAAATLSVMVGVVLVLANVLRLGFVANFISEPVLAGFKTGIGLVIVVDQVPKLLGIHVDKTGFFRDLLAIVQHVPQASLVTVLLSAGIVALIFGLERFLPKWPAPLVAVGAAILASALLGLQAVGVATVGEVPRGRFREHDFPRAVHLLGHRQHEEEGHVEIHPHPLDERLTPAQFVRSPRINDAGTVPFDLLNAVQKEPRQRLLEFGHHKDAPAKFSHHC